MLGSQELGVGRPSVVQMGIGVKESPKRMSIAVPSLATPPKARIVQRPAPPLAAWSIKQAWTKHKQSPPFANPMSLIQANKSRASCISKVGGSRGSKTPSISRKVSALKRTKVSPSAQPQDLDDSLTSLNWLQNLSVTTLAGTPPVDDAAPVFPSASPPLAPEMDGVAFGLLDGRLPSPLSVGPGGNFIDAAFEPSSMLNPPGQTERRAFKRPIDAAGVPVRQCSRSRQTFPPLPLTPPTPTTPSCARRLSFFEFGRENLDGGVGGAEDVAAGLDVFVHPDAVLPSAVIDGYAQEMVTLREKDPEPTFGHAFSYPNPYSLPSGGSFVPTPREFVRRPSTEMRSARPPASVASIALTAPSNRAKPGHRDGVAAGELKPVVKADSKVGGAKNSKGGGRGGAKNSPTFYDGGNNLSGSGSSPSAPATPPVEDPIDYKTNDSVKPPYSYAALICMAMKSQDKSKITLAEIYSWIQENFVYYKTAEPSWQNSIRHNLSLNKCFVKVPRKKDEPGKGGFWRIDPKYADVLEQATTRKRRSTRETPPGHDGNQGPNKKAKLAKNHHKTDSKPSSNRQNEPDEDYDDDDDALDFSASNGMHRGLKNGGPLLSQANEDEEAAAFLKNTFLSSSSRSSPLHSDSIFDDAASPHRQRLGVDGSTSPLDASKAVTDSLEAWLFNSDDLLNSDDFLNHLANVDPPLDFVSGDPLDLTISGVSLAKPDWWRQFEEDADAVGGGVDDLRTPSPLLAPPTEEETVEPNLEPTNSGEEPATRTSNEAGDAKSEI